MLRATGASAVAPAPAEYRLHATVSLTAPHVEGMIEVSFTNHSARTLNDAVFFLFPNRFSVDDEGINDFNRPYVYPQLDFDPGSMDVLEARDAGVNTTIEAMHQPNVPDGCVARMAIRPLGPGETRLLSLRFRVRVPQRFGTFGLFEDQLTLLGGWYPYLAALDADGTWQVDGPPPLANFDIHLTVAPATDVAVNGLQFSHQPFISAAVAGVHYLSLVVAPRLLRTETDAGDTHIVLLRPAAHRISRISPEPAPEETLLAALHDIVGARWAMPNPPHELVVVEAPLRLNLTAAAEGMVVVSDRTLKVHWLLRPFHELQLAQAVFAEALRPSLAARESDDYPWVGEGLSRVMAARYMAREHPHTRSVQEWIELFNIFAIVDRFETAPKIPFVDAFFERAQHADALHDQISTFNQDLPPGHVIFGKLRQLVGDAAFEATIDRCRDATVPFRACAARESGRDLDWFFTQWLQPFPSINYDFAAVHLNQTQDDAFFNELTLRRRCSREIHEPVEVELRSIGGKPVLLRWEGDGASGQLTAVTPRRVLQAVIDPNRKLIETTRADNARPPAPQVVLDTAEVEVSSTEFGISGLVVGRARYDYRKDLAVAGFYTNRSIGMDAGARYHWGEQNDPTLYRHNLYGFYGVQALDSSFKDARHAAVRTAGHTNSLGFRYDYNNLFDYNNPTHEVEVRLFGDWYDRALGSDFDYVDWGAGLTLTHPLWSYRTIVAGEMLNGFSEPLGSSRVPNQGLYSLGGSRSIRGIGAEDQLGRNIFLLRGEIRQALYPEVDLNFLDLLVLRRAQARLFVDSGQVSNAAGAVYDPAGYAVGVGVGFAAVYDFLGFFPSLAYIEVATRVDRASKAGDPQFLFGSRQAF